MSAEKVNIREKLALFDKHWSPKVVGGLNGQHIKLVKLLGPLVWHHHREEDELFFVVKGGFRTEFRDRSVPLEPASTLNTGTVRDESTIGELDRI